MSVDVFYYEQMFRINLKRHSNCDLEMYPLLLTYWTCTENNLYTLAWPFKSTTQYATLQPSLNLFG